LVRQIIGIVGTNDKVVLGELEGFLLGVDDGSLEGLLLGTDDGSAEGLLLGTDDGSLDG